MTIFLTLTTAGADSGPFNLYSDTDGYTTPFEVGVDKTLLEAGYSTSFAPEFTTIVRVVSTALYCTNEIDIVLEEITTTTTTTTLAPLDFAISYTCAGINATVSIDTYTGGLGPYQSGTNFFISEVAALANTSWVTNTSFAIGVGSAPGTYWLVIKDTLGTLKAKSIAVAC